MQQTRKLIQSQSRKTQHKKTKLFLSRKTVIDIICKHCEISKAVLCSSIRTHKVSNIRALSTQLLMEYAGMSMTEIASYFGRTHSTLTRQLNTLIEQHFDSFSKDLLIRIESELKHAVKCKQEKKKRA